MDDIKVIFSGRILDGFDAATVRESFSRQFKIAGPALDRIFDEDAFTLRDNLDLPTAEKMVRVLGLLGMDTRIEQPAADPEPLDMSAFVDDDFDTTTEGPSVSASAQETLVDEVVADDSLELEAADEILAAEPALELDGDIDLAAVDAALADDSVATADPEPAAELIFDDPLALDDDVELPVTDQTPAAEADLEPATDLSVDESVVLDDDPALPEFEETPAAAPDAEPATELNFDDPLSLDIEDTSAEVSDPAVDQALEFVDEDPAQPEPAAEEAAAENDAPTVAAPDWELEPMTADAAPEEEQPAEMAAAAEADTEVDNVLDEIDLDGAFELPDELADASEAAKAAEVVNDAASEGLADIDAAFEEVEMELELDLDEAAPAADDSVEAIPEAAAAVEPELPEFSMNDVLNADDPAADHDEQAADGEPPATPDAPDGDDVAPIDLPPANDGAPGWLKGLVAAIILGVVGYLGWFFKDDLLPGATMSDVREALLAQCQDADWRAECQRLLNDRWQRCRAQNNIDGKMDRARFEDVLNRVDRCVYPEYYEALGQG